MEPSTPDEEIDAMRHEIDAIDDALLDAIGRRRSVVERLRATKARLALPRIDANRESVVRDRWLSRARDAGVPEALALSLLEVVLTDSRALVRG